MLGFEKINFKVMIYYEKSSLLKILIQNFIIILIISLYNINPGYSDIVKSNEFLPTNNNLSTFEFSFYNHTFENKYSKAIENQQYIYKRSGIGIGFLKDFSNTEYAINLNTTNYNKKTIFDINQTQNSHIKIDVSVGLKDKLILKRKWESKVKFLYNGFNDEKIDCFISDDVVIGGSSENCKIGSKEFVTSRINGYYEPAIKLDAHLVGFSIDLKNTSRNWDKKDTFGIAFQTNYINFNNTLNDAFKGYIKNFASEIPQENPWIENNLKLSLIRSYAFEKKWSLAGGIDILYLNRLNYKKAANEKDNNSNIKLEARLTKKFNNFYITIGGYNSLNYMLGIEPLFYNNLSHKSFNLPKLSRKSFRWASVSRMSYYL